MERVALQRPGSPAVLKVVPGQVARYEARGWVRVGSEPKPRRKKRTDGDGGA